MCWIHITSVELPISRCKTPYQSVNQALILILFTLSYVTNSKQVKVVYEPQKVSIGNYFLLRIPNHSGGPGNPSGPIGFNGKSATNFRS